MSLRQISGKASITLLCVLCDAVEHYGKPRAIRTDNEAVFTSRIFRFGLWLLGIKHQRTEKHCPWVTCMDALMSWEAGCRERRMAELSGSSAPLKERQDISLLAPTNCHNGWRSSGFITTMFGPISTWMAAHPLISGVVDSQRPAESLFIASIGTERSQGFTCHPADTNSRQIALLKRTHTVHR